MPKIASKRKLIRALDTPQSVAERLHYHMGEIASLFDDPKMTLVIRSPGLDMPLVMTNDQPDQTIEAIRKMVTVIQASAVN